MSRLKATLVATMLSAAPAQAQISDDVVRIGVLTALSDGYADITGPGSVAAAEMAVEDFGKTVNGKPIEIVVGDHLSKPDVGANIARQWYDTGKVDTIVDIPLSSISLAVQTIARDRGRIVFHTVSSVADLTGKACMPTGLHWAADTYALSRVAPRELVKRGYDTWFFITTDSAGGLVVERDTAEQVRAAGGKVVGSVRHPVNTLDFSSFVLQAQASRAKMIAFANAAADTVNSMKQAAEFKLFEGGQSMTGLFITATDTHGIGLKNVQGLLVTDSFYWDLNDQTRAFAKRFFERRRAMPNQFHAATYSATLHYLRAIKAAGTDEPKKVVETMRSMPVDDFYAPGARLREDGRLMKDMFLLEAKTPEKSNGPWDLYQLVATVPSAEAFRPLSESECAAIRK